MSRQHRVPGTTSKPRVRLIPLPSLALGAAPTTAEIVAAAATLPAIREELREEPGRLAAVDQLVASDREAAKRLAEAALVFGFIQGRVRLTGQGGSPPFPSAVVVFGLPPRAVWWWPKEKQMHEFGSPASDDALIAAARGAE